MSLITPGGANAEALAMRLHGLSVSPALRLRASSLMSQKLSSTSLIQDQAHSVKCHGRTNALIQSYETAGEDWSRIKSLPSVDFATLHVSAAALMTYEEFQSLSFII
eukprot:1159258-Pelagomonas_calceolata.AAC.6